MESHHHENAIIKLPKENGSAIDPICGMDVDITPTSLQHEYNGKTYYFCSEHCLNKFRTDPEGYISKKKQQSTDEEPVAGRSYTCPMHPEIIQDVPGSCPKCGIALESKSVTAEEEANPEYENMKRRFIVAAILSVPLVLIAMGTGTDVAMKSAGVTLVKGDLTGIVRARKLSRATMSNIRQNLFFAFIYNSLGVPVAAGVLYPISGILLSPIIAAAAMSLSSVSVITNSLRLKTLNV